jgi:phage terminase small subunit
MASDKLTPKQERFCQEYIIDLNATQAAIRAGYSAKTANVCGPQNLVKPSIASRIADLQQVIQKRTEITQDAVLKELASIGFANLTEIEGFRGTDKIKCLELLGKHLGIFKDVTEISGPGGGPIQTNELSALTDSERAARAASILDRARARRTGPADTDDAGNL